ncbi:MAG: hypothetical protein ACYDHG_15770 [Desulfomonilaceae bacterium]
MEDAERILNELEVEESRKVERGAEQDGRMTINSGRKPVDVLDLEDLPSQQLDELKATIFTYVVLAPLLSALFAEKIDNMFIACLLFVGLVGTAFVYLKNRLEKLEASLKEQERKLMELEGMIDDKFE